MTITTIYLENQCSECADSSSFSSAASLINHLKTQHGIALSSRRNGISRPWSNQYRVTKKPSEAEALHVACPSCWYHCPANRRRDLLRMHYRDEHGEATASKEGSSSKGGDTIVMQQREGSNSRGGTSMQQNNYSEDTLLAEKTDQLFAILEGMNRNFRKLLPFGNNSK